MSTNFNYTRTSRKFINRFPFWNYLFTQIGFWLLSYAFLAILTNLTAFTISPQRYTSLSLKASFVVALYMGFFNGVTSGIADQFFEKRFFYNKALWIVLLIKAVILLFIFIILISFVRYSLYPYLLNKFFSGSAALWSQESWDSFFYLLLIFNVFVGLVIGFINLVNKKFGPGVLVPLLLGKYRSPKEEERIFLFMDLKSSTSIAELLGHLKYSAFIRDSFMDINSVLSNYNAQIYQYVGDEIIVTWTIKEGLAQMACLNFFFACQAKFKERSPHYEKQFGEVPEFKAGLHIGMVTAVEVGDIKRDIAYHGDTVNTAARIQSVCNEYGRNLLLSEEMLMRLNAAEDYLIESLGSILLKGKSRPVKIASIQVKSYNPTVQVQKG